MAFLRDEHGRLVCKDGTLVERPAGRRGPRRTEIAVKSSGAADGAGGRVSHLRVDQVLGGPGALRDEYERLLDDPNTRLKDLQAWLAERGHHVNHTAINRHRHRHLAEFRKVRQASRMAQAFCAVVRKEGPGAMTEAAQGRFEMLLMQNLFEMKDDAALAPGEWERWAKAVDAAAANRRTVEKMRRDLSRRAGKSADGGMGGLTEDEKTLITINRVNAMVGLGPIDRVAARRRE